MQIAKLPKDSKKEAKQIIKSVNPVSITLKKSSKTSITQSKLMGNINRVNIQLRQQPLTNRKNLIKLINLRLNGIIQ